MIEINVWLHQNEHNKKKQPYGIYQQITAHYCEWTGQIVTKILIQNFYEKYI